MRILLTPVHLCDFAAWRETRSTELPGHGLTAGPGVDRFHQNRLGQLFADGESSVAHLANKISLAGKQLDDVILAKSQLAEPILNFGRRAQLLNPDRYPGLDSVQGTNFATGFVSHFRVGCSRPVHNLLAGVSRLRPFFTTRKLSFYGHNLQSPSPERWSEPRKTRNTRKGAGNYE